MSGGPFPFIMMFLGLIDAALGLVFLLLRWSIWLLIGVFIVSLFI